ncbi:O-antigen ligase family protein [Isoptericola haloaureus]|uniref:O-antigen ligase family protein n=1 Tax=Isoptericola haloaureus TaxID=1542902 RepID=A0ABU7Z4Z9_9MICO
MIVAGRVLGLTAVAAGLAVIGFLLPEHTEVALGLALLVLVVGLTFYDPVALPVLAMPALVIILRVGAGGLDLSVSDVALFGALCAAVLLAPRPFSPTMRSLLWLTVVYQMATLFTVLANPYLENTVEWFHAWLSTAGALVVGWSVGRAGRARVGLTLFLGACLVIAVLTLMTALQQLAAGYTGPVYLDWPWAMHKNLVGCVLCFAALVAWARPSWVGWPRWFAWAAFWACAAGTVASQARQALVALAVGVILVTLRGDPDRKRSKLILLAAIPAVWAVFLAVAEQLSADNEFNSANQRLTWFEQSLEVWRTSPWFGVGLRWWSSGRTEYSFQPPNAELEVLSTTGVVGLAGFVVLFGGTLIVLWRADRRFGTLAVAVVLAKLVQGQFDLFWTAVVVSVPMAIAGVCVGAEAYARSRDTVGSGSHRREPSVPLGSLDEAGTGRP